MENNNIKKLWIYYLIIAIISFVLYGQSINNDFNIDDDYVYENHKLVQKGIKGIPEIFTSRYNTRDEQYFGYRPFTIAIYAVEYEIFGSNPHSAHFINIMYYIFCCFLLFYMLQIMIKNKFPAGYVWISFLIVLVFQTHAIHSEVVLSLKNREEIVSLIFSLISVIFSIKFYDNKKVLNLIFAVLSLGVAFLAKESSIVFIVLIPLLLLFFRTNVKISTRLEDELRKSKESPDKKLKYTLVILMSLFVFLAYNFSIYKNFDLRINPYNLHKLEYIMFIGFIGLYVYMFIKRRKKEVNIFTSKNIIIWITSTVLFLASNIVNSDLIVLVAMSLLFITFTENKNINPKELKLIENLQKKTIFTIFTFIIISGVVLFVVYYTPKQVLPEVNAPVYKWQNPAFATPRVLDKAAISIYSFGYYTKLLLIPYPLRFYYGYKMIPDLKINDPLVLLSLFFHLFLLIVAIKGFNKRSLLSLGILFYFISIFPLSNTFFPLTGIIAERLLFAPSIGFSFVILHFVLKILKKDDLDINIKSIRNKSLLLISIIILPNSIISIKRNPDWKNRETLYTHDIKYLKNSAKANTIYANMLIGKVYNAIKQRKPITNYRNQIDLAIKHFNQAANIDSTYSNPWHNLGYINMIIYKKYDLAYKQFSNSIKCDSFAVASYLNRGITSYYLKNYQSCINDLNDYLTKNLNFEDKEFDKAYVFLAKSNLAIGDTAKSTEYYLSALENLKIKNLNKAVIDDIKKHFLLVERYDLAIKVSDVEISLNPEKDAPFVDKGNYYLLSGDTVKAIENWEIAFEKFNGNFNIGMTLYNYYYSKGNTDKANYYYSKATKYRQSQGKK